MSHSHIEMHDIMFVEPAAKKDIGMGNQDSPRYECRIMCDIFMFQNFKTLLNLPPPQGTAIIEIILCLFFIKQVSVIIP